MLASPFRRRLITCAVLAGAAPALRAQVAAATPSPCDDFYDYVNGAWIAATPLPDDRARIGSFDTLRLRNQAVLASALNDALADRRQLDTPGKRLAADYYASGMDLQAIEKRGLTSIQPLLAAIDALADRAQLAALIAQLSLVDVDAPLSVGVQPDARDKRRHRVALWQSGLGLPDRDDYFRDDARAKEVRDAYRSYLTRLLVLGGASQADAVKGAATALLVETRLAHASLKRTDMRDPTRLYNPMTVEQLRGKTGGLDWAALFDALALRDIDVVVVGQPGFVDAINALARELPLPAWQTYLRLRLLDGYAVTLPADWQQAHFAFRGATLRGLRQRPPRSEEVIDHVGGPVGSQPLAEGLGELFVARAFSPQAKARAVSMVEDIKQAMRQRIGVLDWMSEPTKKRALAKLDAMRLQIGYPDRWKTYDGLVIDPTDYSGNALRAQRWENARRLARLHQPVDRGEWFASPHIVNAFAGGFNNIVFPAGILQPPFFDAAADDATNFGGIGMVIGHEITHHFDDRGRRFDEVGNLSEWWTAEDARQYQLRADRLAAQYSGYVPLPGHNINGVQTLGENISDLGGIKIAYDGLQIALTRTPPPAAAANSGQPTPQQRFFISYATIWRDKIRAEALITQLRSGQHSPPRYRVLGPLANMPAFSDAFGCPPSSPMLRAESERVTIW
ncbi:MAG: M13 family metallopeptidase [Burkholderiaceae bacterium]|jgi:predicted metalloendopeptidase|nr:M13 family metallopeptidase [Burkholderiaceae bacterium]